MVPPSSQDETLSHYSVSGEVPRSFLKVETVLGTLAATQKVPRHIGLPREECLSPRVRLECNPEIPVAPGEEHWLLDTSLDEVY